MIIIKPAKANTICHTRMHAPPFEPGMHVNAFKLNKGSPKFNGGGLIGHACFKKLRGLCHLHMVFLSGD